MPLYSKTSRHQVSALSASIHLQNLSLNQQPLLERIKISYCCCLHHSGSLIKEAGTCLLPLVLVPSPPQCLEHSTFSQRALGETGCLSGSLCRRKELFCIQCEQVSKLEQEMGHIPIAHVETPKPEDPCRAESVARPLCTVLSREESPSCLLLVH